MLIIESYLRDGVASRVVASLQLVQVYPLFAERAFEFLLQPDIDAFRMEFVRTGQGFHHLASLEVVKADGAGVLVIGFL